MPEAASWWLRPRVVFSILALVVVLAVLLAPAPERGAAVPNLTTHSVAPNGARGLHDLAKRFGWPVARRLEPFRGVVDSTATYAVLMPPIELTSGEVGTLLAAVRAGAGLVVVPLEGSPIADSLGLRQSRRSIPPLSSYSIEDLQGDDTAEVDPERPAAPDTGEVVRRAALYDMELHHVLEATRPLPIDTMVFLRGRRANDPGLRPVVLGRPLGRGRVVAIADPAILLNDTMRDSGFAVLPIRLLEWASPVAGAPVVFAEFHHGFGRHASLTRAVARGLVHTPAGRAVGILAIAALLLVMSRAIRPMPPIARQRIERRSPLEHVTALARAYEQIGATRTTVRNLVRGLRRRRVAGRRSVTDTELLRAIAERHPAVSADVDRVIAATEQTVPPAELLAVGRAIATIERTIYQ